MVEHPVDHYASDGHIEPDGQRPAGYPFVKVEASAPGAVERDEDKRNNHGCQDGMRPQQGKIKGSDCSMALKVNYAAEVVTSQVEDQEGGRCNESRYHARLMGLNLLSSDEDVPHGQQNCAESVEASFNCRKIGDHADQW